MFIYKTTKSPKKEAFSTLECDEKSNRERLPESKKESGSQQESYKVFSSWKVEESDGKLCNEHYDQWTYH